MSGDQLTQRLAELYDRNRLPHFLLLTQAQGERDPSVQAQKWVQGLLRQFFKRPTLELNEDAHPDLLTLYPDKNGQYKVDHDGLKEWWHTADYNPIQASHRVIVLFEAQELSETLQNKSLKILEEPHPKHLILWVRSRPKGLLPTIESRAVKLTIGRYRSENLASQKQNLLDVLAANEELAELTAPLQARRWHEVFELLKQRPETAEQLFRTVVDFELSRDNNLMRKAQILQSWQWFERAQQFGLAPAERWIPLLNPYI